MPGGVTGKAREGLPMSILSASSDLSIASSPARIRKHHAVSDDLSEVLGEVSEAVYSIEPRLDVRSRRVMVRINETMSRVRIVGMRPHGCMPATLTKGKRWACPGGFQRCGVDSVRAHRFG